MKKIIKNKKNIDIEVQEGDLVISKASWDASYKTRETLILDIDENGTFIGVATSSKNKVINSIGVTEANRYISLKANTMFKAKIDENVFDIAKTSISKDVLIEKVNEFKKTDKYKSVQKIQIKKLPSWECNPCCKRYKNWKVKKYQANNLNQIEKDTDNKINDIIDKYSSEEVINPVKDTTLISMPDPLDKAPILEQIIKQNSPKK